MADSRMFVIIQLLRNSVRGYFLEVRSFSNHWRTHLPDQVQALRIFFAAYFFSSALEWHSRIPFALRPLLWFSSDLWGLRTGLERRHLWLDLSFLRDSIAGGFVLLYVMFSCGLLAWNRYPKLASTLLLFGVHVLGYAAQGRSISYDMISLSYMGYWAGLVLAPMLFRLDAEQKRQTAWLTAFVTLAGIYASAAASKLVMTGFDWVSAKNVSLLLRLGEIRHQMTIVGSPPPLFLSEFFSSHPVLCNVLLSGVLVIEGIGALAVVFAGLRYVCPALLISLHIGFSIFVRVLWAPLLFTWAVFLIPWNRMKGVTATPYFMQSRLFSFCFAACIFLASWILPETGVGNTASVWPLSKFNMYARIPDPMLIYYFRSGGEKLIKNALLLAELQMSVQQINFPRQAPEEFCRHVEEKVPLDGRLRKVNARLWRRTIQYDPGANRLLEQDGFFMRCLIRNTNVKVSKARASIRTSTPAVSARSAGF